MSDEPAADDADAAETEDTDGLEDGDFVRLAYTARTVEDGDLVDTTDAEVAEEADIDTEEQTFEPRIVVLGANQLFAALEDAIEGTEVGDEGSVTIPAAEAFGEYDQEQVRTISADRIDEDERYPGARVQVDGEQGFVQTIIGSRARVDFNHPLAGEDIEYEFEVLDVIEDKEEQARGMLSTYFDVDLEMEIKTDEVEEEVTVEPDDDEGEEDEDAEPETEIQTVEKETLYVESNPQLQFNQQWMMGKQQIAQDLIRRVGIDRVIIQEIIDGSPGGMMGGMGGMMGGMGGAEDIEAALDDEDLEDADIEADEIIEELEDVEGEGEESAADAEQTEE